MDRFEYKYLVPLEDLSRLRRAIAPFVALDKYAQNERGEYTVRSIYFDTFALDYYYQKLAGIKHRKKIRIRGYNERQHGSPLFLEIKRKDNMAISKQRAPILFRHAKDLFATGNIAQYIQSRNGSAGAAEDARRFFYHVYRHSLRPTALITYEREAFFQKFEDSVRITFDKNLRSSPFPALEDLFAQEQTAFSLKGYFILEAKFYRGIPSWLKTILEDFNLEREAVSKYTISIDAHRISDRSSKRSTFAFAQDCRFGERPRPDASPSTFPTPRYAEKIHRNPVIAHG